MVSEWHSLKADGTFQLSYIAHLNAWNLAKYTYTWKSKQMQGNTERSLANLVLDYCRKAKSRLCTRPGLEVLLSLY